MQINLVLENKSDIVSNVQLFNLSVEPNTFNADKFFGVSIADFLSVISNPIFEFHMVCNINGVPQDEVFFTNASDDQSYNGFIKDFNIISNFYNWGFSLFGGSNSNPVSNISNTNPTVNVPIEIYSTINSVFNQNYSIQNQEPVEVEPAVQTAPYSLIKDSQISQPYLIDELYIASNNPQQTTQSIKVLYKDADGNRQSNAVTPIYDPYQNNSSQIVKLSNPIVLDGETQLGIELLPFTKTNFYLSGSVMSAIDLIPNYINGMKVMRAEKRQDNKIVNEQQTEVILIFDEQK